MANGGTGNYDRDHIGTIRKIRLLTGLAVLLILGFTFVLGVGTAADGGMAPRWDRGRPVCYLRLDRECGRGDVVCIRLPEGGIALRRVVAVAGDTLEIRGGTVYINGLAERGNYSITRTEPAEGGPRYPLLLRQGEVFVLADRREIQTDSRSFGLLTREDILGRVLIP